jgi:2-polyprenyl-3-methyl-5-hydroxy-6-metoxy-1,4-benzoquinol methylase
MSQEKVRAFFNQPGYLRDSGDRISVRTDIVKQFLGSCEDVNILDIGCGDGSLSLPMLTESNHITLVDISENMMAKVSQRVPDALKGNVTLINDSFELVPDHNGYDIVICVGVMAHVRDVSRLWGKIAKVLKPGGLLVVETTPNPYPLGNLLLPYYYIRRKLTGQAPSYAKNRLKVGDLIASATAIGLEQTAHVRYSFPLPGMSHWPHAMKLKYTFFTLKNPLMSHLGSEHIFLFKRAAG